VGFFFFVIHTKIPTFYILRTGNCDKSTTQKSLLGYFSKPCLLYGKPFYIYSLKLYGTSITLYMCVYMCGCVRVHYRSGLETYYINKNFYVRCN